jgi:DNA-binding response OmpR family regulator
MNSWNGSTGPGIFWGRNKLTYVTMLSCRESTEGIVQGLESGADDYLTKPF